MLTKPGGFIKSDELRRVIELDRLQPLLVRCGGCRFTAAAQDLDALINAVSKAGDYVRDVSFPAVEMDKARAAREAYRPKLVEIERRHQTRQTEYRQDFDESQCGGVFDGNQVTSDADPGL